MNESSVSPFKIALELMKSLTASQAWVISIVGIYKKIRGIYVHATFAPTTGIHFLFSRNKFHPKKNSDFSFYCLLLSDRLSDVLRKILKWTVGISLC